ncbi:pyocin knob domain-containing protein [Vibrio parahaemolyticus]|uniref:pyocin knob domain-containing protein n=1 Tax=Vibrio parahaemolyticus TaxID=670 RepID=UPI000696D5DA|nr:pyocin knob domain-containing protein [Vibrio parahaemolyticus]
MLKMNKPTKEVVEPVATYGEPLSLKVTVHQELPLDASTLKVIVQKEMPLSDGLSIDANSKLDVINSTHAVNVLAGVNIADALITKLHGEVLEMSKEIESAHTCIHQDKANAASSASKALTSERNSKTSETNAKTSETKAKTSETNSKTSETRAKASENSAGESAALATTKATEASTSASKALTSERNSKTSENSALASKNAAKTSETNSTNQASIATSKASVATTKATEASTSASKALTSERNSKASEINSKTSETASAASASTASDKASIATSKASIAITKASEASMSALEALASENNAKASEASATASKDAALASQSASKTSETNALNSANAAKASQAASKTSETNALASKNAAKTSETNAANSATLSGTKATEASSSAAKAKTSETNAKASETNAKSSETKCAEYAATLAGGLLDGGSIDLSSGKYPATPTHATFWKVIKAGTVSGVDYGVGDTLIYSIKSGFYKIDNTESVTSVNGEKGAVIVDRDTLSVPSWTQVGIPKEGKFRATGATLSGADKLDVDTIAGTGSGVHYKMIEEANSPNSAKCGTGYHYLEQYTYGTSGNVTQFAMPYGTSAKNRGRLAYRSRYSGEFDDWSYIYSTNNKPTWTDVGGNDYLQESGTYLQVARARWLKSGSDSVGFLPYSAGTGSSSKSSLGSSTWWFANAYVNNYKGGAVDVNGNINSASGSIIINNADGTGREFVANAGVDKAVMRTSTGLALLGAKTNNDWTGVLRVGKNQLQFSKDGSTFFKVYHSADKPTPSDLNVYSKTESDTRYVNASGDTMTGALTLGSDTSDQILKLNASSRTGQETVYYAIFDKTGTTRWGYDGFTSNDSGVWRRVNNKANGKFSFATNNSGDFQCFELNGKKIYNEGFKPNWSDVGGETFWKTQDSSWIAPAKNVIVGNGVTVIKPYITDNKKVDLGRPDSRWKEVWSDAYRGGSLNLEGGFRVGNTSVVDMGAAGAVRFTCSSGIGYLQAGLADTTKSQKMKLTGYSANPLAQCDIYMAAGAQPSVNGNAIYSKQYKPDPVDIGAMMLAPRWVPTSTKTLDLNTITNGYVKNYGGADYWVNKPKGLQYGVVESRSADNNGYQMAFDASHANPNQSTGKFWYRTSRSNSGAQEWGSWEEVYTTANPPKASDLSGLITITKTLDLSNNWLDTGIAGGALESGSYMVSISSNVSGISNVVYTGVLTWFSGSTTSVRTDEILLHGAGFGSTTDLFLRTRSQSAGNLRLDLSASTDLPSGTYTFKFRKLI